MTEPRGPAGGSPEVVWILEKARARIAIAWGQGFRGLRSASPCAGVAICTDYSGALVFETAGHLFAEACGTFDPDPWRGIVDWNDEPCRTQAEVLAAFDRAIELASSASAAQRPPDSSVAETPEEEH